jgi:putative membrane protein
MVGSLNKVWPWKKITETFIDRHGEVKSLAEINILPGTYEHITGSSAMLTGAIVLAVSGFALIFVIEGLTSKK